MKPKTLIAAVCGAGLLVLLTPRMISQAPEIPPEAAGAPKAVEAGLRALEGLAGAWAVETTVSGDGNSAETLGEAAGKLLEPGRLALSIRGGGPTLFGYDRVSGRFTLARVEGYRGFEATGDYSPEHRRFVFEGPGLDGALRRYVLRLEAEGFVFELLAVEPGGDASSISRSHFRPRS